jgi:hypothetical protein
VTKFGRGNEERLSFGRVVEADLRSLNTQQGIPVELGHNLDIGCIRLRSADRWHAGGFLGCSYDVLQWCISFDLYYPGLGADDFLAEIIGADVEGIKVFVAPELDGERLFDDGRPDRLIARVAYVEGRPPGIVVVSIQNIADID